MFQDKHIRPLIRVLLGQAGKVTEQASKVARAILRACSVRLSHIASYILAAHRLHHRRAGR